MDSSGSNLCDIFEIYRRYCDVRSGNAYHAREDGYRQDDESHGAKYSRDALGQLLKSVEARSHSRFSIFDELFKLMSELELIADFSEFSCFYDFVFFMCRENGQKNITVSRAIAAWRLVLSGRFRLLNQWCDFVEKNQRHNISEDTWQQVLAFSRCVYENLEGYDPEGAWPVLIDDFVEHMYRVSGPAENPTFFCSCGDLESQSCLYEDSLPGLKIVPGLKRKLPDLQVNGMESSETLNWSSISKRSRVVGQGPVYSGDDMPTNSAEDCMDVIKHSSPRCSSRSPCAVEGCLSKGFAGLFSSRSYLQFGRERRVSST